jgi:hypothetical protein
MDSFKPNTGLREEKILKSKENNRTMVTEV